MGFLIYYSGCDEAVSPEQNTDTIPPIVSITFPHNSSTISDTIDITADAIDNEGIQKVVFEFSKWEGDFWLWLFGEEDIAEPYEYKNFNTTNYPNDTQLKIRVTAYDLTGNSDEDEVIVVILN